MFLMRSCRRRHGVHLTKMVERGRFKGRIDAYREQIRWIRDKSWHHEFDDRNRRFYSNVANLVRELRAYLRVGGQSLGRDRHQEQPNRSLSVWWRQAAGVDCDDYLRLCESDLYQHLADVGGFTRQQVKEQLMKTGVVLAKLCSRPEDSGQAAVRQTIS